MSAKLLLLPLLLAFACAQTPAPAPANSIHFLPPVLPCVAYQAANCVTCPYSYHINQNQCYKNITGCLRYQLNSVGIQQCAECNNNIGRPDGRGGCSVVSRLSTNNDVHSAEAVASNFGDHRFRIVSLQAAFQDPFFQIANIFMLNGQYKHFIRKSGQPVVSVAYFRMGSQNQYKILYNGSGRGLMMCIITIQTQTNARQINSFVPIGVTNIVDHCGQYDLQTKCLACVIGWHLQSGRCFRNIEGCVSYREHICVECWGFAILVENRCISCTGMSDLNKIVYYRGVNQWIGNNRVPMFTQSYLLA